MADVDFTTDGVTGADQAPAVAPAVDVQCGFDPDAADRQAWCSKCQVWHQPRAIEDTGPPLAFEDPWQMDFTPPEFLPGLEGILARNYAHGLIGPYESGKSSIALELGLRACESGLKVGFVVPEAKGSFMARFWAMADPAVHNPLVHAEPVALFGSGENMQRAHDTITEAGLDLVIIDTVAKSAAGDFDEDRNKDVAAACKELEAWTAAGVSVVLVAHTGHKNGDRFRGASAWGQNLHAVWLAEKRGGASFDLTNKRFKDFDPDPLTMIFDQRDGVGFWGRGKTVPQLARTSDLTVAAWREQEFHRQLRAQFHSGKEYTLDEVQRMINEALDAEHEQSKGRYEGTDMPRYDQNTKAQAVGILLKKLGIGNNGLRNDNRRYGLQYKSSEDAL